MEAPRTQETNDQEARAMLASWGNEQVQEVHDAVARARAAQPRWATRPLRKRLALVRCGRHALAATANALALAIGNARRVEPAEALVSEVLPLADACRFLEREAERILAPRHPQTKNRPLWLRSVALEVRREPFGVILIIAPANYPLFLPGVQVLQALVAGNAVVLKPGSGGLAVARALASTLVAAGLDRHLLSILPESPAAARTAIAAGVDKVLLTGSAATGVSVLADLAPRLTPATLELSGCDAAFVRADADLDLVTRALRFSLQLNGGATCIAPRRVFVAHTQATALETRLAHAAQDLAACTIAPAVATLARDALAQGARLIAGHLRPNLASGPLIIADASPGMRLLQEDTFAPVLALVRVQNDAEALAAAGQCPYALGATIFGGETAARALAARVRAGTVIINDVIVPTADPRLPFGGRGRSGYGITRGADGLLDLTTMKTVAVRRGRWRPHFDPSTPQDAELFSAYITAVHGASLVHRAAAWVSLVRTAIARRSLAQPHTQKEATR